MRNAPPLQQTSVVPQMFHTQLSAAPIRQRHGIGRTCVRPVHLDHDEPAPHGVPDAAFTPPLVATSKCAKFMVDTFLLNEEDGDVLGLAGGIMKAIAGGFKRSRHLPSLHDEMLGEKWVLEEP